VSNTLISWISRPRATDPAKLQTIVMATKRRPGGDGHFACCRRISQTRSKLQQRILWCAKIRCDDPLRGSSVTRAGFVMQFQNAILVVAHPDDEILWFSSILDQCKRVLVCFGPSATSKQSWDSGRATVMETYPLTKVEFLKVRQSDAFDAANWNRPTEADSGLQLRRQTRLRYERNAEELLRLLEPRLKRESLVITHNPWGEYGHAEHVQVFRVLSKLRERLGFEIVVTGYVSNRSALLMSRHLHAFEGDPILLKTDTTLAHTLKTLYVENDCWTWTADYEWPEYEPFYRLIRQPEAVESGPSSSFPLNYIGYDFAPSLFRRVARRYLPLSVKSRIKRALSGG